MNPYADFFHWELSNGHVIVDICDTYAEHDEGLGLGNFPLASAPLPHPFCTCVWYVDTDKTLDQIASELGRWEQGEDNQVIEKAFGQEMFRSSIEKYEISGIMDWDSAEFKSKEQTDIHVGRHLKEFSAGTTQKEYIEKARILLNEQDSPDIDYFVRSDGSIDKYSYSRNELVIGDPDGTIKTFFRPKQGAEYWRGEHDRN